MNIKGFKNEYKGLDEVEVVKSRQINGANRLEAKKKKTIFHKVKDIFLEPMFLLLLVTSTIYFLLGEYSDGIIMLFFVFFISGIDIFQEWRTDKALETLKNLSSLKTKVLRENQLILIDSEEVVVNDIVVLEEGDKVSFDGKVLESYGLGINESSLTGESAVVFKTVEEDDEHFKKNYVYAGTVVVSGSAILNVQKVGIETEYGKIGSDLNSITTTKTPLQRQTASLIKVCAWLSFFFFLSVFLVTFFIHSTDMDLLQRATNALLSGITVAMATIPEEFPVVLTVFLAMGAWRLVKQNALVRKMPAVETLGAVSTLCVDKTGTLTLNQMELKETYVYQKDLKNLIKIATLASEKDPFDPMEQAILKYYQSINGESLEEYEFIHDYAFHSENKMMGHIWQKENRLLAVKGAYEVIAPLCNLSEKNQEKINFEMISLAEQGYRVLAVAETNIVDIKDSVSQYELNFLGLIAFIDPPRKEIIESVKEAEEAGIRLIMITGDSKETAVSIAKKVGFKELNVITGNELEQLSDEELKNKVNHTSIFARVYPNHKMRIVEALQSNGEIVAMTGDGVNDAPALKKADIGIAMGKKGTEVAKEAADMILLDDNFKTIIESVKNGRRIYDNIKKAIAYILIIHIPIALASLFIPFFGLPTLLLPIHIVILELIIDPTSSIVFERQKEDKEVMSRLPRSIHEPLICKKEVIKSIIQGIVIFLCFFFSYSIPLMLEISQSIAMTFAFTVLLLSNLFVVLVIQSKENILKNIRNNMKDPVIFTINFIILLGIMTIVYSPWLHNIMGTSALSLGMLLLAIFLAFVSTFWIRVIKR